MYSWKRIRVLLASDFLHYCFHLLLVGHIFVIIFRLSSPLMVLVFPMFFFLVEYAWNCLELEVWFLLCSSFSLPKSLSWICSHLLFSNWMSNSMCNFPIILTSCIRCKYSPNISWLICLISYWLDNSLPHLHYHVVWDDHNLELIHFLVPTDWVWVWLRLIKLSTRTPNEKKWNNENCSCQSYYIPGYSYLEIWK